MKTDKHIKDLVPLIELLKMEADQWADSGTGEASQSELFHREQFLLEMWPESCRRAGVGVREFPAGVIKLWKDGSVGSTDSPHDCGCAGDLARPTAPKAGGF